MNDMEAVQIIQDYIRTHYKDDNFVYMMSVLRLDIRDDKLIDFSRGF